MILRLILIALILTSCGRELTQQERAFLSDIHGEDVAMEKVRIMDGAPVPTTTFYRKARPRVA